MHRPAVAMELQVPNADAPSMRGKPIRKVAKVMPHTARILTVSNRNMYMRSMIPARLVSPLERWQR